MWHLLALAAPGGREQIAKDYDEAPGRHHRATQTSLGRPRGIPNVRQDVRIGAVASGRPNQRLRDAMDAAAIGVDQLAEATGFDPKSVYRWVRHGIVPRRVGAKKRVAQILGVTEDAIWPREGRSPVAPDVPPATDEIVAVWAHRADVPKHLWWTLLSGGETCIQLVGYAMQFLPEDHPRLNDLLVAKAAAGARVCVALADPDSRYVAERDAEERLGGTFRDRIRTTIDHLRPVLGADGIDLVTHDSPMYCSVFRADDELFYTPHLFGLKGYLAPLYWLRRHGDDGPFDGIVGHVERLLATTKPLEVP
jgi:hypothetical protein